MSYTNDNAEKTIQRLRDIEANQAQGQRVEVPRKSTIRTGWTSLGKTLSYVSSTSVSYPATQQPDGSGGVSYPVDVVSGMKLKLEQSGETKYFYITYVSMSTLTETVTLEIIGNTLLDEDISNACYSYVDSPSGFPHWFDWTPTLDGFSSDPTGCDYRFRIGGGTCFLHVYQANAGTSDANNFTITAPVLSSYISQNALAYYEDNGTLVAGQGYVEINGSTNILKIACASGLTGWTTSGDKKACFHISYEFTDVATELMPVADVVTGAPTIEMPTLSVRHNLVSQDILVGAPAVEEPTAGLRHDLTAQDISVDTPTVENTTLGQEHGLSAQDVTSGTPTVEGATLGQEQVLAAQDVLSGTPVIDSSSISQDHELSAQDVTSGIPAVEDSDIGQDHEVSGQDVTSGTPTVDTPTLSENP